jgi:hypothetical protein
MSRVYCTVTRIWWYISYWLPLNEGFKCNCIKTNKIINCNICVVCKLFICVAITIFGELWNVTLVKSFNQHLGTNLLWSINFLLQYLKKNNTFVYIFNVCCQGETRRCLVVQRHLCFERTRGDNSTTNRVLKIYWPCIEYTRFPRDHFKPMISLEVCKK